MKNKRLLFLILVAAVCLNTACHKCVECIETNALGKSTTEWPEICGKKKDIDNYRKYMENNVDPDNKVKCEERKTTLF
jgi:hypothetical protein